MIRNEEQIMFVKENFFIDGPYLRYRTEKEPYGVVLARFKYSGGFITKGILKKWLIKHSGLTPSAYLAMIKTGISPVDVMRTLDEEFYYACIDKWNEKAKKWG